MISSNGFKNVYYDMYHSRIHHWYTDENGKGRHEEVDIEQEYYLYDKENKSDIKDIYGLPVIKETAKSYQDLKMLLDSGVKTCEAKISQEIKFLQKTYGNIQIKTDISNFNIGIFDVEVETQGSFPKPEESKYPINLISIWISKSDQVYTFGTKDYTGDKEQVKNYIYCATEEILLQKFITFIRKCRLDVLSGWNIKLFDVPYVIGRCEKLKIDLSLSPLNIYRANSHQEGYHIDNGGYSLAGLAILDYIDLYKNFTYTKREKYTLDAICMEEIQDGKIRFDGELNNLWKEDWNKFVLYNVQDVLLVKKLDLKLRLFELAVSMCHESLIPLEKVFSAVNLVTGMVLKYCHKKDIVIPDCKISKDHKEFEGAHVMAKEGYFKWCENFDIVSMYPHAIMAFNLSPETLVYNPLDNSDLIKTPLEGIYYKKQLGILPEIVKDIFDTRVQMISKRDVCIGSDTNLKDIEINKRFGVDIKQIPYLKAEIESEGGNSDYYSRGEKVRKILMNCFHKDTQILTVDGVKFIKDVKVGDMVYSINKEDNNLEIKPVEKTYEYNFEGELISLKGKKLDLKVTEEHMLLEVNKKHIIKDIKAKELLTFKGRKRFPIHNKINSNRSKEDFLYLNEFISNKDDYEYLIYYPNNHDLRLVRTDLNNNGIILDLKALQSICRVKMALIQTTPSDQQIRKSFELGYIIYARHKRYRRCSIQKLKINVKEFSKFIGMYLSEGCLYTSKRKKYDNGNECGITKKITICQYKKVNPEIYKMIEDIFSNIIDQKTGITKDKKTIGISSDLLYQVIEDNFGKKHEKHIFNNNFNNILDFNLVFDYMYLGDGNKRISSKGEKRSFRYTISLKYKKLFDDYMKLCLILGYMPHYSIDSNCYRILITTNESVLKPEQVKREVYKDKVYNLTVADNHTVYVGMNGKFMWTGQSLYGSTGSPYFCLYNVDISRSVTAIGRDLIKYLTGKTNDYLIKNWHVIAPKLLPEYVKTKNITPLKEEIVCLIDTDSGHICMDEMLQSIGYKMKDNKDFLEFTHKINDKFFNPFYDRILNLYAERYNSKQLFKFKPEKVITKKLVVAMKKYVDEIIEKKGQQFDPPKLAITGIEIVRTDTPKFCRNKIKEVVQMIFDTEDRSQVIDTIKKIKSEFFNCSPDQIAKPKGIKDYGKYSQTMEFYKENGLSYAKSTPQHNRAAINYNYLVSKYNLPLKYIDDKEKIKMVYVYDNNEINQNIVAMIGQWPEKFSEIFTVDYESQWSVTFEDIIGRFFHALKWNKINLESNSLEEMFS
jgi:DNA polymerase elongation subunit (family B)